MLAWPSNDLIGHPMVELSRYLLIFVLSLSISSAQAQSPDEMEALRRRIDQLQQSGQYSEALPLVEQLSEAVRTKFGENSGENAAILARHAGLLQALGRYPEAEASYTRALAIATAALGPEHAGVTYVLNDLALLFKLEGRFTEAEPLYQKALAIREKTLGPDHPAVAHVVSNLAALYVAQGRYTEAEPLFTRAIGITEKALKPDHPEVGKNLNNLATLYWAIGRFNEAEPLYKRALSIVEGSLGIGHPAVSTALNNLAALYQDEGRYAEAEPLYQRSLQIREKALGPAHRDVGESANNLAWFYQGQRRYAEAEPLYRRAIDISEKALGPGHATVGSMLNNLAVLYYDGARYAEAEPLFKRAISVRQGALGAEHSDVGQTMYRLARLYEAEKRFAEAGPLHLRALEIRRKAQGSEHPEVIQSLDGIAHMYEAQKKWKQAVDAARQASDIVISRARKGALAPDGGALESGRRELAQGREVFRRLVRTLWALEPKQPSRRSANLRESYIGAHWAEQTEASIALAQMSLRQAKGKGRLSELIRERQDLAYRWQALDKQLYASIAQSTGRNVEIERELRDQLTAINARRTSIDETLNRDFPDYFALSNTQPLSVQESKNLLKPDEALVQFMISGSEVFVWAITNSAERWMRSSLDAKALTDRVSALRCGLDDTAWNHAWCQRRLKARPTTETVKGQPVSVLPFNVALAHELYNALLGPMEDLIRGKQLLIVAAGSLSSLPFHVLVTQRPPKAIPATLSEYRKVAWLGNERPISVLPSAASLKALRQHAKVSRASQPYLGVGNPLLLGQQDDATWGTYYKAQAEAARAKQVCGQQPAPQQIVSARGSRSPAQFSSLFRGTRADTEELRKQSPLPETADELCAVAKRLGAPQSAVLLGERATEGRLKELSDAGQLDDYAILHFATHGALSGEVLGSAEPGLILTPPSAGFDDPKALERDDGFLTASEIAALKLDADWVVLSACNTAGSASDTSEALSGMARAFFYAGTRAILVSHWAVVSEAAVKLITRAFATIKVRPTVGRAEALRIAMRELIEKGSLDEAHPSRWAPFMVVGEGRR
jgi:CHAT domain-containing protein/tetratricopeptide (TPR) repeat protein